MKELHNHIFSNTTCISKETMLRYINKQLQKEELYEVEKHMLDCELCSDAFEGLKYATNSSILLAIDNQIDLRVSRGNSRTAMMRNLMVAASLLVIIFGAYFSISYFTKTINSEKNLALNQEQIPLEEKSIEKAGELKLKTQLNTQESNGIESTKDAISLGEDKDAEQQDAVFKAILNNQKPPIPEQSPKFSNVKKSVYMDEISALEEENIVSTTKSDERIDNLKGENEKQQENLKNASLDNRREDNVNLADLPVPSSVSTEGASLGVAEKASGQSVDDTKAGVKKEKNATKITSGKKRAKYTNAGYAATSKAEEANEFSDRNQQNTITIDSYKVVDYTTEFQQEYDKKQIVDTKTVSADFETKVDQDIAEKERDETIVEVTYKETLEKAIALYKNKKYSDAIDQFNIILSKHPTEVNSWFYGGLSDYHLQRYEKAEGKFNQVLTNKNKEFHEEATWYKALSLLELKQTDKAKKILKEIIATNGFYKAKAEEKLKGL
ncbi:MAG: hypothetical protein CO118_00735 [Flavobacteriales bacterium CG_4_9_14_3_um_filter_32_8]|nr:MAG: hypothetical protein CO118_00735 [Flavobacteriales bacterium CG_4_9_14_3_um_filter_32_8]